MAKPVLVLRQETERPEAIQEGIARLVGLNFNTIVDTVQTLLDDTSAYKKMTWGASPYGDGKAAGRITKILEKHFLGRT